MKKTNNANIQTMFRRSLRKWVLSMLPLATGLTCAQVLGTLYVRHSNQVVLEKVRFLSAQGWLSLPTGPAVDGLTPLSAAFWGGLFFTLSVGAGLTLTTWALVSLYKRYGQGNRAMGLAGAGAWAVLLLAVNLKGLVLFPSLFVLAVPPATAWPILKRSSQIGGPRSTWLGIVPILTLALLTGLWTTQLDKNLFILIRDHLLLSNPAGRAVNDFYYRYTLHAAEPFKSFEQKTTRSCRLAQVADAAQADQFKNLLARHDVLVVDTGGRVDLTVAIAGTRLTLTSAAGDATQAPVADFTAEPAHWLQLFSASSDRQAPFRRLVFAGLLIGFPILLYMAVYGVLRLIAGCFSADRGATVAASSACLAMGVILLVPVVAGSPKKLQPEPIAESLASTRWTERVAALRQIHRRKLEIDQYRGYRKLLGSPLVAERYWLARALAVSRAERTYNDLLHLVSDDHPNVVCQALYALGVRGRADAVERIAPVMRASDHWYVQWYAYRAMRRLGWTQKPYN